MEGGAGPHAPRRTGSLNFHPSGVMDGLRRGRAMATTHAAARPNGAEDLAAELARGVQHGVLRAADGRLFRGLRRGTTHRGLLGRLDRGHRSNRGGGRADGRDGGLAPVAAAQRTGRSRVHHDQHHQRAECQHDEGLVAVHGTTS